jgi:hypothetical protein
MARRVSELHPAIPVLVLTDPGQPHVSLVEPRPKKLAFISRPFSAEDLTLAVCYLFWEAEE